MFNRRGLLKTGVVACLSFLGIPKGCRPKERDPRSNYHVKENYDWRVTTLKRSYRSNPETTDWRKFIVRQPMCEVVKQPARKFTIEILIFNLSELKHEPIRKFVMNTDVFGNNTWDEELC